RVAAAAAARVGPASNLSLGSDVVVSESAQAHLAHVSTLSGPGSRPYPASYPEQPAEEPTTPSRFPAAFQPPALASWAILCPLGDPPSSRSAHRTRHRARTPAGLPCSTRARHDRGGRLLYPGTGGVPWPGLGPSASACRVPAAGPAPRYCIPPCGAHDYETS